MNTSSIRAELTLHSAQTIDWQPLHIPAELKALPQWKPCYLLGQIVNGESITTPKRPIYGAKLQGTDLFKPVFTALKQPPESEDYQHFGFIFTRKDEILGIDVDNLPPNFTFDDLPLPIRYILTAHPTYAEVSPSGQGLHIIYRTDKTKFDHRPAQDKATTFNGSIFIRDQFMTFTGHKFGTSTLITTVPSATIEKELMIATNTHRLPVGPKTDSIRPQLPAPSMEQLEGWLSRIPTSLSKSPAFHVFERVYQTFTPPQQTDDYNHWILVGMALHHGAGLAGNHAQGEQLFDAWSANDPDKYDGPEATAAKYKSFSRDIAYNEFDPVTYLSLAKLATASAPTWPHATITKLGPQPLPGNVENFLALIDHYGLRLRENEISKEAQLTGNPFLVDRYFTSSTVTSHDALKTGLLRMCHDTYFKSATMAQLDNFIGAMGMYRMDVFNPIKQWIDETPAWSPSEPSYFEQLFQTLKINPYHAHNTSLYRSYIKKSLMGIIRACYYTGPGAATTGMVILQGREQTNKSFWVEYILPPELNKYVLKSNLELGKGRDVKEVQMQAAMCAILVRDEVESWLQGNDADLKNLLTQSTDTFRAPYAKQPQSTKRRCIMWGTTNRENLRISDDGSRRIQVIPIEYCDTYCPEFFGIPRGKVFRELLYEFEHTPQAERYKLWNLDKDEITVTNALNFEQRTEQEADMLLKEVFNFDEEFNLQDFVTRDHNLTKKGRVYSPVQVQQKIRDICGVTVAIDALQHALRRQCGNWTGTLHNVHQVSRLTTISKGYGRVKKPNGTGNSFSAYLLPNIKSNMGD